MKKANPKPGKAPFYYSEHSYNDGEPTAWYNVQLPAGEFHYKQWPISPEDRAAGSTVVHFYKHQRKGYPELLGVIIGDKPDTYCAITESSYKQVAADFKAAGFTVRRPATPKSKAIMKFLMTA